ncbi:hypothetical protein C4K29_3843 [Pseudomonas chlororaphis subsp. piscium]|nr:hypothetical protein C4K29_3843 [Pseudomonas chlororaphis subsp. piscium]
MGSASVVNAADQSHGTVSFTGAVIDAPCSIAPDSIDQVVELGQVSNVALQADGGTGSSKPQNFEIRLESCALTTANTVTTTFTGAAGKGARLGVSGEAKGASIVITDSGGNPIELGKPVAAQQIQNGNNTLQFAVYMQGDGQADEIVPGDFKGIVDFSLAYQ